MKFRPCIDIHNGKVKQIVGSSLDGDKATENFVSEKDAAYYAGLYKQHNLSGGHIIMLNPAQSMYYDADCAQAFGALTAFNNGMQIGGSITADNAKLFIDKGASHIIVTSYVFQNGGVNFGNLEKLVNAVGKSRLVLDLSCRRRSDGYFIVTDRWMKFTNIEVNRKTLDEFSAWCDEILIHAVDVEGKSCGIDEELGGILTGCKVPVTYAGGIRSMDDIKKLEKIGGGKINFTVGTALDLFGGNLKFEELIKYQSE